MSTLWHGRFEGGPAEELLAFTVSLPFDRRLAPDDIAGSRAHVRGLVRAGMLTDGERDAVLRRSTTVEAELATGTFAFVPSDEDIHTAVERRVTELAGPAGAKLHTGRQPQRPGRHRPAPVRASGRSPRSPSGCSDLQQVLLDRAGEAGDAYLPGLHPPPAGPARAAGPPPAGPRLGARAATSTACSPAGSASTCRRSARGRWPARRCRSTPTAWPPTSASPARFENSLDAV